MTGIIVFNELLKFEAILLLALPIPLNYEDWCFLHTIIDGDV